MSSLSLQLYHFIMAQNLSVGKMSLKSCFQPAINAGQRFLCSGAAVACSGNERLGISD